MANVSASPGALLHHVRTGRARSRAELVALTGASRNTVSGRVDQLIAADLLAERRRWWSTVTHQVDGLVDPVGALGAGERPTPSSTWTPVPL